MLQGRWTLKYTRQKKLITRGWILVIWCHVFEMPRISQSVQSLSCVQLFATSWTAALQACPSPTPEVYSNSCASSWWCHPTISSSVIPFSSRLQSFPASGSFPLSQFFASGGQSIGVSALASVLSMNIQDWFHLGFDWLDLLAVQGTLKSFL